MGYGVSFSVIKYILKLDTGDGCKHYKCNKNPSIAHFKVTKYYTLCEFNLNCLKKAGMGFY